MQDVSISIFDNIKEQFKLKNSEPSQYSPLTLAFIGDCVFDLVVKSVVVLEANCSANMLHRKSAHIVKAESQAIMTDYLLENGLLSEEETVILRRGRNAKSYTTAKNASVIDYRKATGIEALIGYLYLEGRTDRIVEIIKIGMELIRSN